MKKHLTLILCASALLLGGILNVNAQREVVIDGYPLAGGANIEDFVGTIQAAFDADEALRATDPNVTYVLKRDHLYPNVKTIKNTFSLRMVAEEGAGAKPVILTWDVEGKYKRLLEAQADVYFENIQFDNVTPSGVPKSRCQRLSANGIRGEFVGCIVYQDDGGAFNIYGDSCKIFLRDCFVHNCGTETAYDSNGRFLDVRADNYCDSVVIQNCTGDHLNGSFLRAGNAVIGYLKIDHITSFNSRAGDLSTEYPKEVVITNNLFKDAQMPGDVPSTNDPLETNPDKFHASVINFDTIWDASKITIRNNNVFWSDEVQAMWAKYDTIFEPLKVNPMAMRALGADSIHAAFSEVVTLKTICDPPIAYIEGFILDQTTTAYPSQHCLGGDGGGYFPDEIDASYNTDSESYTAGDDGYPLGDLNWWPELKAKWENGETLGQARNLVTELVKVYPNPANDRLFISTEFKSSLRLSLYNILGEEVHNHTFNNGFMEADVSFLKQGFYLYRISEPNGNLIQSGKVLINK
jgi:hypothetical protein